MGYLKEDFYDRPALFPLRLAVLCCVEEEEDACRREKQILYRRK